MKLYLTLILIMLFASCSNKQFSFRQKVNVKSEHIVKKEKHSNKPTPEVLIIDSINNESFTASVLEGLSSTNNFVEEVNAIATTTEKFHVNNVQPSDTAVKKSNPVAPNNKPKTGFPYAGIAGLLLTLTSSIYLYYIWVSNTGNLVGFLMGLAVLFSGITLSIIGLKKRGKVFAIIGLIMSILGLMILIVFVTILLLYLIFLFLLFV